ncbi:MAG: hypothetical protein LBM13_04550 [Candidatus Ancillula sp.]|jgi:hypothetical protein|nr:hypothetical protein [Candidatus Ancillula sp.]
MKNVSLVRMTVEDLAKMKNISYSKALDLFYRSDVAEVISNEATGLFTYTPYSLAKMIKPNREN